jgi:hypothetical protein
VAQLHSVHRTCWRSRNSPASRCPIA